MADQAPHSPDAAVQWVQDTAPKVIDRLRERYDSFQANPRPGTSAPTIEQQEAKYTTLKAMLDDHDAHKNSGDRKASTLERIIRGYLSEFVMQCERLEHPCNIKHGRNPEAGEYYAEHPDEFRKASAGGIQHSVSSHLRLREQYPRPQFGRSPVFHALSEVIRASVDVFKEQYPKFSGQSADNASIYNDHMLIMQISSQQGDFRNPRLPWPSVVSKIMPTLDEENAALLRNELDTLGHLNVMSRYKNSQPAIEGHFDALVPVIMSTGVEESEACTTAREICDYYQQAARTIKIINKAGNSCKTEDQSLYNNVRG